MGPHPILPLYAPTTPQTMGVPSCCLHSGQARDPERSTDGGRHQAENQRCLWSRGKGSGQGALGVLSPPGPLTPTLGRCTLPRLSVPQLTLHSQTSMPLPPRATCLTSSAPLHLTNSHSFLRLPGRDSCRKPLMRSTPAHPLLCLCNAHHTVGATWTWPAGPQRPVSVLPQPPAPAWAQPWRVLVSLLT